MCMNVDHLNKVTEDNDVGRVVARQMASRAMPARCVTVNPEGTPVSPVSSPETSCVDCFTTTATAAKQCTSTIAASNALANNRRANGCN